MKLRKSEAHPFVAIRCYANFFINDEIIDDYFDNHISEKQWFNIFERVKEIENFINEKKGDNIVPGVGVIGKHTASIITKYIQAEISTCKVGVGEPEKRRLLSKIGNLTARSSKEKGQNLVFLYHQFLDGEDSVILEEIKKQWIEALERDIRCIDLGPIYKIILICGSDILSVEKVFDSFPDIELRIL